MYSGEIIFPKQIIQLLLTPSFVKRSGIIEQCEISSQETAQSAMPNKHAALTARRASQPAECVWEFFIHVRLNTAAKSARKRLLNIFFIYQTTTPKRISLSKKEEKCSKPKETYFFWYYQREKREFFLVSTKTIDTIMHMYDILWHKQILVEETLYKKIYRLILGIYDTSVKMCHLWCVSLSNVFISCPVCILDD